MITEDYCSYEVAKLLKEKGFDWPCHGSYHIEYPKNKIVWSPKPVNDGGHIFMNAPTHQMAMKWLRESHKLSIEISSTESGRWMVCVYELGLTRHFVEAYISTYDTYKYAVEAALKYCLTELI